MSSYYTTVQLEEMRKAQLKRELADSIQELKEQLWFKHKNNVQMTSGSNIETTVFIADNAVSGYSKNAVFIGDMLQNEGDQVKTERDELDFSGLLLSARKKPTELEQELDSWVKKVDERPIVSDRDEKDRARLLTMLAKIINESTTDIEDKIRFVKMRVLTYLQGGVKISTVDIKKMESTYFEYYALCEIFEVNPTERFPYRVEKEVARMTSVLEKRRQDEYVMTTIEDIMETLGCHAKDSAVLDHTVGQMYAVDGYPLCDVFIGNDGSGIMFEPVGDSKDGSTERKRQVEISANSVCFLYKTLEERAAEKGVFLKRVYAEPVCIGEMYVQSNVSERSSRKRQRKTSTQKQKAVNSEG